MKHRVSAQEYMNEYRSKISSKYKELKTSDQLTNSLQKDESNFKSQMRSYVTQLQSTDEYKDQTKQYHKDMKKVKKLFAMILNNKNGYHLPERTKNTFVASKDYFYIADQKEWDTNQKVLRDFIKYVPTYQKDRIMNKVEGWIKDPEIFRAEIQKLIDSKPHMELGAKIKEVAGRVVGEYDLWPIVGGCLLLGFLLNLQNIPPKDGAELFSVSLGTLASALRVETGVQGSITHTRKLHREQKEKRAEKNAKEALRR